MGKTEAVSDRLLGIYLNDHLAGSVAAEQVARRTLGAEREGPVAEFLRGFIGELQEDRGEVVALMERLGVPRNPLKSGAAWAAEKAGRLKLNGRLLTRSPLSLVEELEFLLLSVEGKVAMWRLLRELQARGSSFGEIDLQQLIDRGNRQRDELERLRVDAAARAFGS